MEELRPNLERFDDAVNAQVLTFGLDKCASNYSGAEGNYWQRLKTTHICVVQQNKMHYVF